MGIPGNLEDLSGGTVECTNFYVGNTIHLLLNDLSSYKITLKFMLFSVNSGQAYTVALNNNSVSLTTSSTSYSICGTAYIHQYSDLNFSDIALNNTLTFISVSNLYLAEILVIAYKCNDLCLECSQS